MKSPTTDERGWRDVHELLVLIVLVMRNGNTANEPLLDPSSTGPREKELKGRELLNHRATATFSLDFVSRRGR